MDMQRMHKKGKMTLHSIDIETYEQRKDGLWYPILDCTKFVMGAIKTEGKKKTEFYTEKQEMWKRLKQIAQRAHNRKKVAYVYGHNVKYDFYGIADFEDKQLKIYSHQPFIATLSHEGKETMKILDSMSIWNTSLKQVGKMLEYEKLEMPKTIGHPRELRKYLERDVEVCLQSIVHAKELLKRNEIKVRRLYTIGQIAMNKTLNEFKNEEITTKEFRESFFEDEKNNKVWQSQHPELIRAGYRGATEHAIPGKWNAVDVYDFNGLYQWAAMHMKFPKMNTEKVWKKPKKEEIIDKIGITRCMIKNETCEHGLLQIRTPNSTYIPKTGKTLIGTWTNRELRHAEQNGYKILSVEWSITYEETDNPYKKVIPKLNKNKEEAETGIERSLWKGIANHGFGKWGQIRTGQEIVIDNIEEIKKYTKRNYDMTHGVPGTYMMIYRKKRQENSPKKSYYAPIIPALINAEARCIMYDNIKKLPYEKWLYTGCDSIITTDTNFHRQLDIGGRTGQFKTVLWKTPAEIIAKKHYKAGKQVKAAGIRRTGIETGDFERKKLKNKKMITLMNTGDTKQIGKFITEIRDLNEIKDKYETTEKMLKNEQLYIDNDITDITHYLNNRTLWKSL